MAAAGGRPAHPTGMPKAGPPLPQCWQVVGGADKGGLLVREGQDLKSQEVPGRLATGAVVKELQLAGDRLQYRKLRANDAGPETGWVSVKLPGKELLVKCEAPEEPDFSKWVPQVDFSDEPGQRHLDGWTRPLDFERIANLRDVAASHPEGAAIPCADGKTLKRGLLFRSGHWICATKRDIQRLKDDLGIVTYIDLRDGLDMEGIDAPVYDDYPPSPHKRHKDVPEPSVGTRRRLWCPFTKGLKLRSPTLDEQARTVSELDRRAMNDWFFRWMNSETLNGRLQLSLASQLSAVNRAILFINHDEVLKAMRTLTDRRSYPLLFGCVAGKDRTGILACLILGALGVSEDLIMQDYLRTNAASAHISACAQVGEFLWWREMCEQNPRKWEMYLKAGRLHPLEYGPASDGAGDPFVRGVKAVFSAFGWERLGLQPPPEDEEPAAPEVGVGEAAAAADPAGANAASSQENLTASKVYRGTMEYTLGLLREQGGVLAYLESIGFGPDDVAKLREILTE
uniref:Tyrosine specific protein phosphatases domain-containing protein n=1 Tax=Alexandrium monilatum TaxID=311494 RepID=A0A7S4REK3_9DINO